MANKPLEYKGHPLQRAGNIVYYGSMSDKYVIMLQIMGTKKAQSLIIVIVIYIGYMIATYLGSKSMLKEK